MAINKQMKRFFREHKPSRDRLTCSCGWEALEEAWVDHLAYEMQFVGAASWLDADQSERGKK